MYLIRTGAKEFLGKASLAAGFCLPEE